MKKKVLSLCLVIALVAIAAISTTLAYFTDTDINYNTMTVGNVEIDQFEKMLEYDENGVPTKLVDYVDPTEGMFPSAVDPAFGENADWSTLPVEGEHADGPYAGWNQLFVTKNNAEDKIVFVKNTGNNDVYYRTIILFESDPELNVDHDCTHFNLNGNSLFDWNATEEGSQNDGDSLFYKGIEIDGVTYDALVATYTAVLKSEEISRPSLMQVFFDKNCTQDCYKAYGDKLDIYCFTQAVQTKGFDNAYDALDTAFGKLSVENIQSWIDSEILTLD